MSYVFLLILKRYSHFRAIYLSVHMRKLECAVQQKYLNTLNRGQSSRGSGILHILAVWLQVGLVELGRSTVYKIIQVKFNLNWNYL